MLVHHIGPFKDFEFNSGTMRHPKLVPSPMRLDLILEPALTKLQTCRSL
ncbi:hypothetical protein Z950_2503 [Sulfitobacter mediterraneus KCTC 32188]|nr:hypothetical protein Z950_2503 [Sulfitobacter mediterraneus KCTC 32188]